MYNVLQAYIVHYDAFSIIIVLFYAVILVATVNFPVRRHTRNIIITFTSQVTLKYKRSNLEFDNDEYKIKLVNRLEKL